ncbi:MAG: recombinase family protein [Chloroflexota bacterium]
MKAAVYIRVSTGGQEENYSPKTQEDACRAYCAEQGYELSEGQIYRETFTGAALHERPKLADLRSAVRQKAVGVVVSYSLDRLSRKQTHVAILADEFEAVGCHLKFVTEDFEEGPVGTFIRGAKAFAAELEREKIKERTGRGRRERVESGLPMPGAKAPYGYRWMPDIVVPGKKARTSKPALEEDPVTSWVVRRIFDEAATGRGQQAIADDLTADGIPTPTGTKRDRKTPQTEWGQTTIRCILQNQFYVGRAASFRCKVVKDWSRGTKDGRVIQERPEQEWIALPDGVVPALVEADKFAAVQERFQINRVRAKRVTVDPERLLLRGGHVKCGYCGHNMFVHRNGNRLSYRCIRRQRFKDCPGATHVAEPLDDQAWAKVEELLLKPEVIARELDRLESDDPTSDDLDGIDKSIAQVQTRRRNLLGQLGLLDPEDAEEVRLMLKEAGRRLRELETERAQVIAQRETRRQARTRLAELETWCRTVAANLGDLTYDQKRTALTSLGLCVYVWRHDDRAPKVEAHIPLGDVTKISTLGSTEP